MWNPWRRRRQEREGVIVDQEATNQQTGEEQPENDALKDIIENLNEEKVLQILENTKKRWLERFIEDLKGEWDENLDRVVRSYRSKIARKSWHTSQQWCKWNEHHPILFPNRTRLFYRKGDTEVLVQEFEPCVRQMRFKGSLVCRKNSSEAVPAAEQEKVYRFSLGLPYCVFIFHFHKGVFQRVYLAFNDRPLKKLNEKPLRPYLSNLDSNLNVCLGSQFDKSKLEKGDIFQQCTYVLDHFWHTTYSDEWSAHYWNTKEHFVNNEEARMSTLKAWEEATSENPLFVIEDVNWLEHNEESFGSHIVRLFEGDSSISNLHQELYDELSESFVDEVKDTIVTNLDTIKTKTLDNKDEGFKKELAKDLLEEILKIGV